MQACYRSEADALIALAEECANITTMRKMILSVFDDSLAVKFLRNGTYASVWVHGCGAYIAYSPRCWFGGIDWAGYEQAWYYHTTFAAINALNAWDMLATPEPAGYTRKLRTSEQMQARENRLARMILNHQESRYNAGRF